VSEIQEPGAENQKPHRRRVRYSGKHPRRFEDKYKEHGTTRDEKTIARVLASGKTPAGTHRPIMVTEIMELLAPKPGDIAVDCTLGYGGHTEELLRRITPGGRLLGLDADPIELPKTEQRLRALGFGPDVFTAHRSNYAGIAQAMAAHGLAAADCILADLGVSSMQLDDPTRGFSTKHEGPLDLRMNPQRGLSAAQLLLRTRPEALSALLIENSDEPEAECLAGALAGRSFETTIALAKAIRSALPSRVSDEDRELSVRRVFQALRIAVNEEFSALDMLLRQIPACLKQGGRVAILTFHSGEDRRVKKSFAAGLHDGLYSEISREVGRATAVERHANPRSTSAKLRWAVRA
jgi:16S rRNA (cytosine1402-N4)-methyltransferase